MFWLEEAGLPMTGANIARAMQLSPPTVHEMVGRLVERRLRRAQPDKSLSFTESGREHASHIVRRHRMIERFLTDVLGIPWDEVHEEAERIEHAMSPVLEERMRAAIGDATTCPHGHPIVEGIREQGSLLADVEVGADVTVLRFENEAEELLHYLKAAGPGPGPGGQGRELRRRRGHDRLRRRQARGQPQRRRDRLGPRRPGAAAAGGDPGAAGALLGPLRPLGGLRPRPLLRDRDRDDRRRGRRFAAAGRLGGDHHHFDAVHVGDQSSRRCPSRSGTNSASHRFDFAVAPDPGLEHPVVGQLVDVGEAQGAAVAFADHLRGDAGGVAGDDRAGGAAAATADPAADRDSRRPRRRPAPPRRGRRPAASPIGPEPRPRSQAAARPASPPLGRLGCGRRRAASARTSAITRSRSSRRRLAAARPLRAAPAPPASASGSPRGSARSPRRGAPARPPRSGSSAPSM